MKLIIDIPEAAYKLLQSDEGVDWLGAEHILGAVANGIPLPKGHGRLIDAEEVKRKMGNLDGFGMIGRCIDEFPTIIVADKAEGVK